MKRYINHRKQNGLKTQVDMAKELDMSPKEFSHYKVGHKSLTRKVAERMYTVTGFKPSYWLNLYNVEKDEENER